MGVGAGRGYVDFYFGFVCTCNVGAGVPANLQVRISDSNLLRVWRRRRSDGHISPHRHLRGHGVPSHTLAIPVRLTTSQHHGQLD